MISDINKIGSAPLISFALFAFNQEKYIREAIRGAFSQTYTPLQIILSDDSSSDHTYDIIKEMALSYDGPHEVIINRNDSNLHIGGHINRVMELALGELIVGAAGDDISEPERTALIVDYYYLHNKVPCSIYSDANYIDNSGNSTGYYSVACPKGSFQPIPYAKRNFHGVLGATHAWHKSLFEKFGPLPPNLTYEDDAIPFRAALIGEVIHIPKPLVRYRRHDASIMCVINNPAEKQLLNLKRFIFLYDSNLADLMHYCLFIKNDFILKDGCINQIYKQKIISKHAMAIIDGSFKDKIASLLALTLLGSFRNILNSFKILILSQNFRKSIKS